jgi:hypothetical protein
VRGIGKAAGGVGVVEMGLDLGTKGDLAAMAWVSRFRSLGLSAAMIVLLLF